MRYAGDMSEELAKRMTVQDESMIRVYSNSTIVYLER